MSVVVGLNFHHADSSACVLVDGELKAAIAEERLGLRIKHDPSFPGRALDAVLQEAGVTVDDITHVALPRDPTANLKAKVSYVASHPVSGGLAAIEHLRRREQAKSLKRQIADELGCDLERLRFDEVPVEHHLAHVSSAYYCSPFEELTAGFSYDASGDFVSLMAARCEGDRIDVLDRVPLPSSLGFFYTALCQFIGFDGFGEEYKVMGLAPYGRDLYQPLMEEMVRLEKDGWFSLDGRFFGMHNGGTSGLLDSDGHVVMGTFYSAALQERLGPPRRRDQPITQREMDIARSCQVRFQRVALHCINQLHHRVPTPRIAYAGGCALNGVANSLFLRETPFESPYLQCASSDDGTSLGAALWAYHNVARGKERFHMKHAYWGRSHTLDACEKAAQSASMPMRTFGGNASEAVAELLHRGMVVAWYQGRSEWGPRALGNRSILASPLVSGMKDTINRKIKKRESFRPFAPTVLQECVADYFEQTVHSPFMMHVVKVKPEWRERLPAITHVDGTARLQSITREVNPNYHDLISAFKERSGVGIVLNTSFNENEPIIDTPDQAMDCFLRTDLDAICLDGFLVVKPEHETTLQAIDF
ncbi:MAG: carbamoyltransferase C-terminal domain-containing protein [Myxococcota bacterium]